MEVVQAVNILEELSNWSFERLVRAFHDGEKEFLNEGFILSDIRREGINSELRERVEENSFLRVFISSNQCSEYEQMVGWVIKDDIQQCMRCQTEFTVERLSLFHGFGDDKKKVHCKACGNIFCSECIDLAVVEGISLSKEVEVCKTCYWGQSHVQLVSTTQLGRSVLLENDEENRPLPRTVSNLTDSTADTGSSKEEERIAAVESFFAKLRFITEQREKIPQYLLKLQTWSKSMPLKEYGALTLQPVTPKLLMKAFYSLRSKQDRRHPKSVAALFMKNDDVEKSFLYVNVSSTKDVPYSPPTTAHTEVMIFPMVFNVVCNNYNTNYVVDVALNEDLLLECDTSELMFEELLAQIITGLSIFFHEYEFSHGEIEKNHPINTPMSPKALVKRFADISLSNGLDMILPSCEAIEKFKYVYTSMTDLILSANFAKAFSEKDANEAASKLNIERNYPEVLKDLIVAQRDVSEFMKYDLPESFRYLHDEEEERKGGENKESVGNNLKRGKRASLLITSPPKAINRGTSDSSMTSDQNSPTAIDTKSSDAHQLVPFHTSSYSLTESSSPTTPSSFSRKKTKSFSKKALSFISVTSSKDDAGVIVPKFPRSKSMKIHHGLPSFTNKGQRMLQGLNLDVLNTTENKNESLLAEVLKDEAEGNPTVLFGWQIKLLHNSSDHHRPSNNTIDRGSYVITGVRRSFITGKPLFRISSLDQSDQWITLQLPSSNEKKKNPKNSIPFQLIRQVII
eukprot:gene3187-3398_t